MNYSQPIIMTKRKSVSPQINICINQKTWVHYSLPQSCLTKAWDRSNAADESIK